MPSMPEPRRFKLNVPESALVDLNERLARTRFPDEPPNAPWATGASVAYLKELLDYWRTKFSWREQEAKLNSFAQYKAKIRGIDLHFIHEPGRGPNPMPLLLSHGWPGSVWEFHKLIPLLTEHFTVVAPSLPGYTMSFQPGQARFGVEEIADTFADLMTNVLGYKKFGAQGGDWGGFVTSILALKYPERLTGIHLNLLPLRRDPKMIQNPTPEEAKYLEQLTHFLKEETGYQWIQGTKPTTLAFGLTDSPAGLAAWLVEKFRSWTDNDGTIESAISRDDMLSNIALYWFTGAIGSSFWPYYARMHRPWPIADGKTIDVPMGYAEFPREILSPPRSLASRVYTNIKQWTNMKKGGHFAALEQPQELAEEINRMFRGIR
jgi:pimeloyl-ACP methyl ester carboxylesterase